MWKTVSRALFVGQGWRDSSEEDVCTQIAEILKNLTDLTDYEPVELTMNRPCTNYKPNSPKDEPTEPTKD